MNIKLPLGDLKKLIASGVNISSYLKDKMGITTNDEEIIEISYDLQSGSYVEQLRDQEFAKKKMAYIEEISALFPSGINSILEAGVGEATTLQAIIGEMPNKPKHVFGFDISWSRLNVGKKWLRSNGVSDFKLCVGSLLDIPFQDNSFDVVFTSHAVEPNGGKEEEILRSLYRVTNSYLILFEPDNNFASDEAKERMNRLGYCKDLHEACRKLGMNVIKYGQVTNCLNKLNPTSYIVVKKDGVQKSTDIEFACPRTKSKLIELSDCFYTKENFFAYPKIDGIPCLRPQNAIIASGLSELI